MGPRVVSTQGGHAICGTLTEGVRAENVLQLYCCTVCSQYGNGGLLLKTVPHFLSIKYRDPCMRSKALFSHKRFTLLGNRFRWINKTVPLLKARAAQLHVSS